jgi:hypothetical protein
MTRTTMTIKALHSMPAILRTGAVLGVLAFAPSVLVPLSGQEAEDTTAA